MGGTTPSAVPTLRASWSDMNGSFEGFVHKHDKRLLAAGLGKIVPPTGWTPRREGYNDLDLNIERCIKQVATGSRGLYRFILIEQKPMSLKKGFQPEALAADNQPGCSAPEEVERKYWRAVSLNGRPPQYAADIPGSLFDQDCKGWNLNHLETLLSRTLRESGHELPGVSSPYLYFGMWRSTFAWHCEDLDLFSVNYLHYGAPKHWYCIPPAQRRRFETLVKGLLPDMFRQCPEFFRHKELLISPQILDQHKIPYLKVVQHPGEFIITYPGAYHAGFNAGYNCAESVNFGTRSWIPIGARAGVCDCSSDSVKIDMRLFRHLVPAKLLPPELLEDTTSEEEDDEEEDEEEEERLRRGCKRGRGKARGQGRKQPAASRDLTQTKQELSPRARRARTAAAAEGQSAGRTRRGRSQLVADADAGIGGGSDTAEPSSPSQAQPRPHPHTRGAAAKKQKRQSALPDAASVPAPMAAASPVCACDAVLSMPQPTPACFSLSNDSVMRSCRTAVQTAQLDPSDGERAGPLEPEPSQQLPSAAVGPSQQRPSAAVGPSQQRPSAAVGPSQQLLGAAVGQAVVEVCRYQDRKELVLAIGASEEVDELGRATAPTSPLGSGTRDGLHVGASSPAAAPHHLETRPGTEFALTPEAQAGADSVHLSAAVVAQGGSSESLAGCQHLPPASVQQDTCSPVTDVRPVPAVRSLRPRPKRQLQQEHIQMPRLRSSARRGGHIPLRGASPCRQAQKAPAGRQMAANLLDSLNGGAEEPCDRSDVSTKTAGEPGSL